MNPACRLPFAAFVIVTLSAVMFGAVPPSELAAAEDLQVVHTRCEYLENPLAIDTAQPRLSWQLRSDARGTVQEAYQIQVASQPDLLAKNEADLWDSGKVESRDTLNIPYEGEALKSRQTCYWKVHVWGRASGQCEAESETARWSMGLLDPSDWKAKYISYRDESPVFASSDSLSCRGSSISQGV